MTEEEKLEQQKQAYAEWQTEVVEWLIALTPYDRDFIHGHIMALKIKEVAAKRDEQA